MLAVAVTRLTLTCAVLLTVSVATTPAQATCNRACLTGFVDTYFKALAANDPAAVPLAPSAKPTLNGKAVRLADAFWASADRTIYRWDMTIRTIRAGFQMIRYTTSPALPSAQQCGVIDEPLTDVLAIELPFGKQRRVAVAATVTPRSTLAPIRVVAAHFDANSDRVEQAEALGEWIAAFDEMPLIVGGVFNARRGVRDRSVEAVSRHVRLESCGTNRTNRWPLRVDVPLFFVVGRIDFMFSTLDADVTRSCQTLPHAYESDHLPVLLEVRLK